MMSLRGTNLQCVPRCTGENKSIFILLNICTTCSTLRRLKKISSKNICSVCLNSDLLTPQRAKQTTSVQKFLMIIMIMIIVAIVIVVIIIIVIITTITDAMITTRCDNYKSETGWSSCDRGGEISS